MRRLPAFVLLLTVPAMVLAQTKRPPARRVAPPVVAPKTAVPEVTCPASLGVGVSSGQSYCDVMTGNDPAQGIIVTIPPHRGPVKLTFELHNRHTYSEEQVRANRAFARYTATIGVLTMDNTLVSRAIVQNEFRTAGDLVERVGGGAGPGGVKAVAPTGAEAITITIPDGEDRVSLLGEKLTVERLDGTATYTSPGRPIAVVNNLMVEYRPASSRPAPRPAAKPAPKPPLKQP
jgi:hypothetical protein